MKEFLLSWVEKRWDTTGCCKKNRKKGERVGG